MSSDLVGEQFADEVAKILLYEEGSEWAEDTTRHMELADKILDGVRSKGFIIRKRRDGKPASEQTSDHIEKTGHYDIRLRNIRGEESKNFQCQECPWESDLISESDTKSPVLEELAKRTVKTVGEKNYVQYIGDKRLECAGDPIVTCQESCFKLRNGDKECRTVSVNLTEEEKEAVRRDEYFNKGLPFNKLTYGPPANKTSYEDK